MRPFRYERADDEGAALAAIASPEARFLGGGTNLVDLMRIGVEKPALLVDVTRLPFSEIEDTADGGLLVGAGVRNSDLAADRRVRDRYPALAQALLAGASGQLRNLATTGGNLLQRTRCPYFYDITAPCNKREPGAGCSALDGDHRNHAILGWSEACIATHPSDMAVPLVAFDALVHVRSASSKRTIPVEELHRLPGDAPDRDTVLGREELIVGVELPALPLASRSRYTKVRERSSFEFALVSVAAGVEVADGVVEDVRIALGGVAHKPWRAREAEAALLGAPATEESFRRAADAELAGARPLRGNSWKVELARNALVTTLLELVP